MNYVIRRLAAPAALESPWDSPEWNGALTGRIDNFRPEGSAHRPVTEFKLQYDAAGFYGLYRVHDQYVRSVSTQYCSRVWEDSCVEFFVEPPPAGKGYFNFEFNCGGAMLVHYVTNWVRDEKGLAKAVDPTPEQVRGIRIFHSMPAVVEPEITTVIDWRLGFFLPFSFFTPFVGAVGDPAGQTWRANFYKCGDAVSHPHWGSWRPVGGKLNFHQPEYFGPIVFG